MTFDYLGLKVARTRVIFRRSNHNVPPGSSAYIYTTRPKAEFDGTDGLDGWDGWDGISKGSFNFFFILCTHIDKIYIYLYTKKKLSPTLLWVSKFDVKLGVVIKNFKFTAGT